jgi:ABC-type sulfate transport system permease component
MSDVSGRAATWKRVIASILDFFTVMFVAGYVMAIFFGSTTSEGFSLSGVPTFAVFAIVVAYFFVGRRYADGTLWDRIFRIRRPQPA